MGSGWEQRLLPVLLRPYWQIHSRFLWRKRMFPSQTGMDLDSFTLPLLWDCQVAPQNLWKMDICVLVGAYIRHVCYVLQPKDKKVIFLHHIGGVKCFNQSYIKHRCLSLFLCCHWSMGASPPRALVTSPWKQRPKGKREPTELISLFQASSHQSEMFQLSSCPHVHCA